MKKGLYFILLFVAFYVRVVGDDFTLTTAVVRDGTSPKPTAIYRRIHIDQHVEERMNAPLDLFRLRAPESRRTRIDIWNWDYWCQLQPKKGNCTKNYIRYYYDSQIDQCTSFNFTGCNKNNNNFRTVYDCERFCKGAVYMSIKNANSTSFCSLQPTAGLCMAFLYMYYYDLNENACKQFIYGGCGGNQNRFSTLQECTSTCR